MMQFCPSDEPFNFSDPCIRQAWSSFLPVILVFIICLAKIPIQIPIPDRLNFIPFSSFLNLNDAVALDAVAEKMRRAADGEILEDVDVISKDAKPSFWRTFLLCTVALVETLAWIAYGSFRVIISQKQDDPKAFDTTLVLPFILALPWIYALFRPLLKPPLTPPYDLFALYLAHLVMGVIMLGAVLFNHLSYDESLPETWGLVGLVGNLALLILGLVLIVSARMAVPPKGVNPDDVGKTVSPEDYTTLWGWITFSWVYPLVKKGTNTTLSEKDVWDLSPTMQSRPLFVQFGRTTDGKRGLLGKLWAANGFDILMDFVLTIASVLFNYTGPFFLKKILDSIEKKDSTPADRNKAYIYAFLTFLCTLFKAQADVQHLWLGRRASTRVRSELMAAIYDKALKRKDFSGIVDKEKVAEARERKDAKIVAAKGVSAKKDKKTDKKMEDAKDDPRAGADVGKIVNLMSGDANRVCMLIGGMYFLYGAPIEITVACTMLYQYLGWSAFSGFFVLMVGWPLNSYMMKRSIRIQKGASTSRDKRMAVINELVGAIKFIKFFAWEDQWIQRAMDARAVELKWLVKSRTNSVMFSLLWTLSPILVSVVGFFTYVIQGNVLTVSTAFTAITLYSMIRAPLNVIPAWIVQVLQTKVALDRISTYLDEDEVTDQVSTLKKSREAPSDSAHDDEGLGIENGSFKWNAVEENEKEQNNATPRSRVATDDTIAVSTSESNSLSDAESTDHRFELKNISVNFPDGHLTCVTGPTASGKTALLMALLGEMTLQPGGGRIVMSKNTSKVDEHGFTHSISYAAQTPWLRHQSIKDNILFGYPYDEERYKAVVECCALKTDLDIFEDGDATEIGARGVSLSGGQKARVALARAVYARTKFVLLDDPLSAVDSHTARFLFDRLFQGPLLANRTVVLVTHHVELVLPGTHYLVRMLDGRIDTQGIVKDLRAQGVLDDIARDEAIQLKEETVTASDATGDLAADLDGNEPNEDGKKPRKLIKDEAREEGAVKWRIYKTYLQASSYWTWIILGVLIVVAQLLGLTEKLWIRQWGKAYVETENVTGALYAYVSSASVEHEISMHGYTPSYHPYHFANNVHRTDFTASIDLPRAQDHPLFYVGIYTAIGFATATATILSTIVQLTGSLRASKLLFKRLLVGVVRATMRWHDVTPQGRMLNRFSKDIMVIDTSLGSSLQLVNGSLATFFAAILTVAFFFPLFLVPAFAIGLVYRHLAIGYLNTGRDLRRMESNSRSPIFSEFGELLEGIVTVRAFSAERRFLDDLHAKIDVTTKMWYYFWMTNRWLLLNFDALGALAVFVTTLFALSGFVDAGTAALCMTSAMTFTQSIYWACRFWTALELDLNSVERLVEYLDLPQEPPSIIESNRPPAYWPSSSTKDYLINVENLTIRYAPELPAVIHDVSFALKAKERVGLLGRTGSGKSTLAMSILRFVDPASGRIMIDGVDISSIGLHDLRSRLTFIPQDATLFSGTLRENLDPFEEHDDASCMDVLRRVQLITDSANQSLKTSRDPSRAPSPHAIEREDTASTISAATDVDAKTTISLDTQVSAGGTNFSQGQRQLIAMARALLRRSSIIVLDEATSSMDGVTDAKIQAAIREEFNDSLLLTVAHRLRTVIDYDRLIVLDRGQIAEFDTPLNLISKENGIFRTMCLKSGTYSELEAAARAKADRDRQT